LNNFDFDFLDKREFSYKFLVLIFLIISVAIYIGFLIYGDRGLNRLIDLQENKKILSASVQHLKQENVKLQKEFFGLKDIEDNE